MPAPIHDIAVSLRVEPCLLKLRARTADRHDRGRIRIADIADELFDIIQLDRLIRSEIGLPGHAVLLPLSGTNGRTMSLHVATRDACAIFELSAQGRKGIPQRDVDVLMRRVARTGSTDHDLETRRPEIDADPIMLALAPCARLDNHTAAHQAVVKPLERGNLLANATLYRRRWFQYREN